MRSAGAKIFVLIAVFTNLALGLPSDPPALQPYPGTGMFLMLSDIHFNPYADPAIMEQLGATLTAACPAPASTGFSKFGSDTNDPLLKSTIDNAVATARENHFHYDYVIVSGDFLVHSFDTRYRACVGGGEEAYTTFAAATIGFVVGMISNSLPGVPIFCVLGNNDSDRGDYVEPSSLFLQTVGRDFGRVWGKPSGALSRAAVASFGRAGYYALPHPTAHSGELIILNTDLWTSRDPQSCGAGDPDPGGQFQWLEQVLNTVKRNGGTATLIAHIPPGMNAMKSTASAPASFWNQNCTQKLIGELSGFRGVVREMYAGHLHRDDFRLFPDREGRPLFAVHIIPAVSPVYLNNPAIEIGWYDKSNGDLRDYATIDLDLGSAAPTWSVEYVFSRAYGHPPNLAGLEELSREIHEGNSQTGVGAKYADYYGTGVNIFLSSGNWLNNSCAQTDLTLGAFTQCARAGSR